MGKRRQDADLRRFTDEFPSVRVSRFRAMGIVDLAKRTAIIAFPDGKQKLLNVAHTRLKYGGGWSFFICPGCAKLAQTLYCSATIWMGRQRQLARLMQRFDEFAHGWAGFG